MAEVRKLRCNRKINTLGGISKILKNDLGAEVVCEEKLLNDSVLLLCFEEYYFRCSNFVALSVMITESDMYQEAVVAGMGGGDGLANISWGANKSFADRAKNILVRLGFKEI